MIRDVVLPDSTLAEWQKRRPEVKKRIESTIGIEPPEPFVPTYESLKSYSRHDLEHEEIAFEVAPGLPCNGTFVFPPVSKGEGKNPALICVHGNDPEMGRKNVIEPELRPNRAYGIEMAMRGYVVLTVDQFGYGDWVRDASAETLYHLFYKSFPNWSVDGMRLRIQKAAADLLSQHKLVDSSKLAAIGHSLGGRSVLYLAALDERIKATVASSGFSPNITNVYRNLPTQLQKSPLLNQKVYETGKAPFEYQELLALIAPRAILLIEPWNDPYNPYIEVTFECFQRSRQVFDLYGKASQLSILTHGEGHDTPDEMREYAYQVIENVLYPPSVVPTSPG